MKIRTLSLALLWIVPIWPQAQPPDTLVSPEVHSDRRVTFRIRAPQAAAVTFFAASSTLNADAGASGSGTCLTQAMMCKGIFLLPPCSAFSVLIR